MRFINRKKPAGMGDIDATLWKRKTRETVKGPGRRGRGDRAGRGGISGQWTSLRDTFVADVWRPTRAQTHRRHTTPSAPQGKLGAAGDHDGPVQLRAL